MLAFRLSCQKAARRSAGAAEQRPGEGFTRRQRIRIRLLFGHKSSRDRRFHPRRIRGDGEAVVRAQLTAGLGAARGLRAPPVTVGRASHPRLISSVGGCLLFTPAASCATS